MSTAFVLSLAGVAALLFLVRLLVPAVPPRPLARRITTAQAALTAVGLLGLLLHCTAMFFEPVVAAIPGTGPAISQINGMGAASMLWYAVPAVLLLVGLRRQLPLALAVLAVALLAVGITMYNGAALSTHVVTIYAAAVVIAGIMFLLVLPPWSGRGTSRTRRAA